MDRIRALLLAAPLAVGAPGLFVEASHSQQVIRPAARAETPRPFDFRFDVLPHLQRKGCATAECHGGGLGRGGFKLSLFGSDPLADWQAIVVDRSGRRIDPVKADRSLLLRKPLREVKHGGGQVIEADEPAARALEAWIGNGARYIDRALTLGELRLSRLDERLFVEAVIVDSSGQEFVEDVSDRAVFASSDPRVIDLEPEGSLVELGPGDTTLTARFAGRTASLRVVRRFGEDVEAAPEGASPLDRIYRASLRTLGLAPGPRADDETLLRRLTLTLAGRIPTLEERAEFLTTPSERRLESAAKRLLDSDDFVAVAKLWLRDLLEIRDATPGSSDRITARGKLSVQEILRQDVRLDRALVRRLHSSDPLVRRFKDARDRAEWTGRAFLGTRIGCARCHDHPLDRWQRNEHLSLSAVFTDPRPGPSGVEPGRLFDPEDGAVIDADLEAWFGRERPIADPTDRFRSLRAALLEDAKLGGRFARSLANRLFAAVVGRALVDPVDDLRVTNPPVLPEFLDALTERLVEREFRLRPFVLDLVTSELWSRDSKPVEGDRLDRARSEFFARATAKPMGPRVRSRSIATALGVAPRLPASPTSSPLAQALLDLSARDLRNALAEGGSLVDAAYDFNGDDESRLSELFARFLGRRPKSAELDALMASLEQSDTPRLQFREIACALALTRSFSSIR